MDIYTIDFETYFSQTYSLRNKEYNTSEYIRSPEFKAQCVSIKRNDEPVYWVRDKDVAAAINSIKWNSSALLAHNASFDGLILSHHFNARPAYVYDTLSMARALHSNSIGAGLDEVARYYKVGNKLPNVLNKTKGIIDLDDELMTQLGQYCAMDTELCHHIFKIMREGFPQPELDLINLTVKMFIDPILRVDLPAVEKELEREIKEKEETIARSGCSKEDLSSSNKFAEVLRSRGIEPPTKISEKTGKTAWAFAKTDQGFLDLFDHPDDNIRELCDARLVAKSTINETRAIRFLRAGAEGARLPVLLNYYGAHTGRWSAGNKMNMQNLPSSRSASKGALRKAILAPEGYRVVVCDSSQIEVRVNAWLSGEFQLMEAFRNKEDPYRKFGTRIYDVEPEDVDSVQRHVAKTCVLGLGYGMGAKKLQKSLKSGAISVEMSEDECQKLIRIYRGTYTHIVQMWRKAELALFNMANGVEGSYKCLSWSKNTLRLPNGMRLHYPGLRYDLDQYGRPSNFRYYNDADAVTARMNPNAEDFVDLKSCSRIYGAAFVENIVQALARIIIGEQMLEISKKYRVVTTTHDEVVCLAKEEEADECLAYMLRVMSTPPDWCSDAPISAEGGHDVNYSK